MSKNVSPTLPVFRAGSAPCGGIGRAFRSIAFGLTTILPPCLSLAAEPLPRSVLILNQSTSLRPWPMAIIGGIQTGMRGSPIGTISYYVDHLDLYGFDSPAYRDRLHAHFAGKYRDKPIGVIVSIGPGALDIALKLRASVWPATPVVFAAVDEETAARQLPPGVTGNAFHMTLTSMMQAAQAIVPDLKSFAIVGDRFEKQFYYRHFADELPKFSSEFGFIDLMGLPFDEVRRRVATLPNDSVIFYIGINSDPRRTFVSGAEALPLITEVANRPIIVDAETFIGSGAVGGFILSPDQIGRDAGRLALRILDGESASSIPIARGDTLKPIFDWRQLRRWNIDEGRLPAGSDIRFRSPGMWEQYSRQIVATAAVIALQAALILGLLYEHRRRRKAEAVVRSNLSEMAHMNRVATAGQLSASIAHEISQPLAGIVAHANAGLRWLATASPNLDEARATFRQIAAAGHHAAEVIQRIRTFFTKGAPKTALIDINELIRDVLALVATDLRDHDVAVEAALHDPLPPIRGDRIELQQVLVNLIVNAIEAMDAVTDRKRVLRVRSEPHDGGGVLVRIEDSGPGIEPGSLERVFDPFYSTKPKGMGMGLSISRSLVEAHHGRLSVSSGPAFGAVFRIVLPPASARAQEGPPDRDATDTKDDAPVRAA